MHRATLDALANEALQEISKINGNIIQFCGPISTGGFGNVADNIECISSFISECKKIGVPVFDQLAYESRMDTILGNSDEYDYALLEFFYKPILESRKISGLVFLPLWQTSIGSKWEHDFAKSIGIPVFYIEDMLLGEITRFHNKISR